ncbi:unnamed protein product [Eruca vesicaria subsp. sativa]|uniref:Uncharacterized protein n=1 Tax=Eruca vesicaria subsp. sativa TaxID=29727 RepID=A0ABC8KMY9_ERUVS|nr:unnamed protein product [Eruca vesicaria subsp. sativa]
MNHMFYFFLALAAVTAATADTYKPVFAMDGYPMLDGLNYYVLPLFNGPISAGGLTLAPRGDNQCPLYIGQVYSSEWGIPVKFSNWGFDGFVPQSANLNIELIVEATTCVQSTYWWVTDVDSKTSLIAAGPKPEHGEDSSKSFFQIKLASEEFPQAYKFVFCPNDSDCIDVGVLQDEYGLRRLALSSSPYPFVFKEARESATSSSTTI